MIKEIRRLAVLAAAGWLWLDASSGVRAAWEPMFPEPPGTKVVVLDEASMISADDRPEIENVIGETLSATAIPIVVVTIESLRSYRAGNMAIENYARLLFDTWGIGHRTVKVGDQEVPRNLGVLLLVSKGDRTARIELGADWGHRKDLDCQEIMNEHIIASFKRGEFSEGILSGVRALSAMVKEQKLPSPPRSMSFYLLWAGFFALAIFTAVSLARSGAKGWAWALWAVIFAVLGFILFKMATSRSSWYSGGGGFRGGSFGGGFSGGGGATGRW